MTSLFSPGCALMIYKPVLAQKTLRFLQSSLGQVDMHLTCCHYDPGLAPGTQIINTCPGCDKRFGSLYEGVTTISLWEVLANSKDFLFPDYRGKKMTILDACPTRNERRVHDAIRTLLSRMNIVVTEPGKTREKGTCCGDSFYGVLPIENVKEQMQKRAAEMPEPDVVVYCVSCVKAIATGGKQPRYLVDLLFNEETLGGQPDLDQWHQDIDSFKLAHGSENLSNFAINTKTILL